MNALWQSVPGHCVHRITLHSHCHHRSVNCDLVRAWLCRPSGVIWSQAQPQLQVWMHTRHTEVMVRSESLDNIHILSWASKLPDCLTRWTSLVFRSQWGITGRTNLLKKSYSPCWIVNASSFHLEHDACFKKMCRTFESVCFWKNIQMLLQKNAKVVHILVSKQRYYCLLQ